jgi:hypothetical protein
MRTPKSPVGSMFSRFSVNIRNICAVHTPMPFTWVRCSMTSASEVPDRRAKSTSPLERLGRQVFQVRRFLFRQSRAAHLFIAQFENALGSQRLAGERGKALENCFRGLAVQLLVDDGLSQAVKLRRTKLHAARPNALDDGAHDGVRFLEMGDGSSYVMLTSVYVPYTCRKASQISPTVA